MRFLLRIGLLLLTIGAWSQDYGYSDSVELRNSMTRVVITGALGCRILEFARDGRNALVTNPRHNGVQWTEGPEPFAPSGGRFDIGPELNAPAHEKIQTQGA